MGNGNYCKFSHYDHGEMKISKQNATGRSRFSHSKMGMDNLHFSIRPSGIVNVMVI
jgi:hypothetical protein